MIYIASITIPFENCSFVIKIQANEVDVTGIRDSAILGKLMASGEVEFGDEGLINWFAIPMILISNRELR
jgi:hypothetical protein